MSYGTKTFYDKITWKHVDESAESQLEDFLNDLERKHKFVRIISVYARGRRAVVVYQTDDT